MGLYFLLYFSLTKENVYFIIGPFHFVSLSVTVFRSLCFTSAKTVDIFILFDKLWGVYFPKNNFSSVVSK
jgi:hypothetical protein